MTRFLRGRRSFSYDQARIIPSFACRPAHRGLRPIFSRNPGARNLPRARYNPPAASGDAITYSWGGPRVLCSGVVPHVSAALNDRVLAMQQEGLPGFPAMGFSLSGVSFDMMRPQLETASPNRDRFKGPETERIGLQFRARSIVCRRAEVLTIDIQREVLGATDRRLKAGRFLELAIDPPIYLPLQGSDREIDLGLRWASELGDGGIL